MAAVHACMDRELLETEAVRSALVWARECPGGIFTTAAALQRLRFCDHVQGSLLLAGLHEPIDPTVFWDIDSVDGRHGQTHQQQRAGRGGDGA